MPPLVMGPMAQTLRLMPPLRLMPQLMLLPSTAVTMAVPTDTGSAMPNKWRLPLKFMMEVTTINRILPDPTMAITTDTGSAMPNKWRLSLKFMMEVTTINRILPDPTM